MAGGCAIVAMYSCDCMHVRGNFTRMPYEFRIMRYTYMCIHEIYIYVCNTQVVVYRYMLYIDVEQYVAHSQEEEFVENEYVYDEFDLENLAEGLTVNEVLATASGKDDDAVAKKAASSNKTAKQQKKKEEKKKAEVAVSAQQPAVTPPAQAQVSTAAPGATSMATTTLKKGMYACMRYMFTLWLHAHMYHIAGLRVSLYMCM